MLSTLEQHKAYNKHHVSVGGHSHQCCLFHLYTHLEAAEHRAARHSESLGKKPASAPCWLYDTGHLGDLSVPQFSHLQNSAIIPSHRIAVNMCVLSRVRHFATPWTVARQAPLSMEFSRQEYWSGLPIASQKDLPHPGIELESLASPALAGRFFTTAPPRKPPNVDSPR